MDRITKIGPKLWRSLYEGPPQSGRWNVYDTVIDILGVVRICAQNGSPGTWQIAPLTPPVPPQPAVLTVDPSGTDFTEQPFYLTGTLFDDIVEVRGYVDGVGVTNPITIEPGRTNTTMTVSGVMALLQSQLGMSAPFEFNFEIYTSEGPVGLSPLISIAAEVDVLSGIQYKAFTASPNEDVIHVGALELSVSDPGGPLGALTVTVFSLPTPPYMDFSFAVWFRKKDPGAANIFAEASVMPPGWIMRMQDDTAGVFRCNVDGTPLNSDPGLVNNTDWHLGVIVVNQTEGTMTTYLDGVQIGLVPVSTMMDGPEPTLTVGVTGTGSETIGSGAVWTRALTAPEVAQLQSLTTFPPV